MAPRTESTRWRERLRHAGGFALRVPLLSLQELRALDEGLRVPSAQDGEALAEAASADRAALKARADQLLAQPHVRAALRISSRTLFESLAGDGTSEPKVLRSALRYLRRMGRRTTPFGLCAGVCSGQIGSQFALELDARKSATPCFSLDVERAWTLSAALASDEAQWARWPVQVNTTLERGERMLRFVAPQLRDGQRSYAFVALERSEAVDWVLDALGSRSVPAEELIPQLAAALEVDAGDAAAFFRELLETSLLVPAAAPAVTLGDPLARLAAIAKAIDHPIAGPLSSLQSSFQRLTSDGPAVDPALLTALEERIDALPGAPAHNAFRVELALKTRRMELPESVVTELIDTAEALARLNGARTNAWLAPWRERFSARYGEQEVPLLEALDEERGIGFDDPASCRTDAPLLKRLPLPDAEGNASIGWKEKWLLEQLTEALSLGRTEWVIERRDLEGLPEARLPTPPSATALVAQLLPGRRLYLTSGSSRTGAHALSRFAHAEPSLVPLLSKHLAQQEAQEPDTLFAEFVHLPPGRESNIVLRPPLRRYEVPYGSAPSVDPSCQVPVSDLTVTVRAGQIQLRSQARSRAVKVSVCTAHDPDSSVNLPLYRFMSVLAAQDMPVLQWSWGALSQAAFLPRVRIGRVVVSPATWTLPAGVLQPLKLSRTDAARVSWMRAFRQERRVPRHVQLREGSAALALDLENVVDLEHLSSRIGTAPVVLLEDLAAPSEQRPVEGPEGDFEGELFIPLARVDPPGARAQRVTHAVSPSERRFPPGSEWSYFKLYGTDPVLEPFLVRRFAPALRALRAEGRVQRWFFIRYGDPERHLRLRVLSAPSHHLAVREALMRLVTASVEGGLWRAVQDTYEREVERYGGLEGVCVAEEIFEADSDCALAVLADGWENREAVSLHAFYGAHQLLEALGLEGLARLEMVQAHKTALMKELRLSASFESALSITYRARRAEAEEWVGAGASERLPGELRAAFERRGQRIEEAAARLRAGASSVPIERLARSYFHMWLNRVLRTAEREQELVIADRLGRAYRSLGARGG